jgi:hypothetical protein
VGRTAIRCGVVDEPIREGYGRLVLAVLPPTQLPPPDTTPPVIRLRSPRNGQVVRAGLANGRLLSVRATVTDGGSGVVKVTIDGRPARFDEAGQLDADTVARRGQNTLRIRATDRAGNVARQTTHYTYAGPSDGAPATGPRIEDPRGDSRDPGFDIRRVTATQHGASIAFRITCWRAFSNRVVSHGVGTVEVGIWTTRTAPRYTDVAPYTAGFFYYGAGLARAGGGLEHPRGHVVAGVTASRPSRTAIVLHVPARFFRHRRVLFRALGSHGQSQEEPTGLGTLRVR